jgi:hypothetical protein
MYDELPKDIEINSCHYCGEEIEYHQMGLGVMRFHRRTGGFGCPPNAKRLPLRKYKNDAPGSVHLESGSRSTGEETRDTGAGAGGG